MRGHYAIVQVTSYGSLSLSPLLPVRTEAPLASARATWRQSADGGSCKRTRAATGCDDGTTCTLKEKPSADCSVTERARDDVGREADAGRACARSRVL